jgi:hypothetical protein
MSAAGMGIGRRARKRFFFEKKNQKTFVHWLRTLHGEGEANE